MSRGLVFHFFNEQYLLPWFIKQHIDLFDEAIAIDYASTDASASIIRTMAPHWQIVQSKNEDFDAARCDLEVMGCEQLLKVDWKITLNVTEFICSVNFDEDIEKFDKNVGVIGLPSYVMVSKTTTPDINILLAKQIPHGYRDTGFRMNRHIHNKDTIPYNTGRHTARIPGVNVEEPFITWWGFAPWNEHLIQRKLQIQTRIPQRDKDNRAGYQHIQSRESLEHWHEEELKKASSLLEDERFRRYYDSIL